MSLRVIAHGLLLTAVVLTIALPARYSRATVVEFQTSLGNFEVNLADTTTPLTVTNFLQYVNNGLYTNSIIHRSVPGFVSQGGGFTYDQMLPLDTVPEFAAVANEPEFSSLRGSIAMAKIGGNPDSATSQWFINLDDNSSILDDQNGGFTVFGQVVGNGMDVVDAIAALPVYGFTSPLNELPLRNYTATDFANGVTVDDTHLVMISAVVITDSTADTSATLTLTPNTAINPAPPVTPPVTTPPASGGGGGGGAVGVAAIFGMILVCALRRRKVSLF